MSNASDLPLREKIRELSRAFRYRPLFTAFIIVFGFFTALLEAIGLSFLIPIIEIAQADGDPVGEADGVMLLFAQAYELAGIPFTLGFVILGVTSVMAVRYISTFFIEWITEILRASYIEHLQTESYRAALDARTAYYDKEGSDEILNAIVTQAARGGDTIRFLVEMFREVLLAMVYLGIAFYISPILTIGAGIVFGVIAFLVRYVLEPGYAVGNRVADANERIQESVQAGTQGIRDVKLFGLDKELFGSFQEAIRTYVDATVTLARNEAALNNFYQLAAASAIFGLIYVALVFFDLSLAALGVFLFAIFQLAPKVGRLNRKIYNLEGNLPHLVRTHEFIAELNRQQEAQDATHEVPDPVSRVAFEDVEFGYDDEQVLSGVSFEIEDGEFVAFVGPSGAGKSTIVSLLSRMYEPNGGRIDIDGVSLSDIKVDDWRSSIAVVRQNPHIFNDTLWFNLTLGNRDATQEEVDRVCEMAQVTEFLDGLPKGYDTDLGDDGVQLSGGQRQRVALARALLEDSELLILDEATSDLDSHLEQRIHQAIESVEGEYTIIAIAHRLSTVTNADRIYTLEDGEVIETGDHESLIDNQGKYAELYAIQSN